MFEIKGRYTSAKIMIDDVEPECIDQIKYFIDHPAFTNPVAIMPDCHSGKGSVIGFTMPLSNKVIPNVVGVDLGCLDRDTEFLSPTGWVKISKWKNEQVLQYDPKKDSTNFVSPLAYIKKPCTLFYHFRTKYGMDQMLTPDHKMIVWKGYKGRGYIVQNYTVKDFVEHHNSLNKGIQGGFKTTFQYTSETELPLSDVMVRIEVMVAANGSVRRRKQVQDKIELHFRKKRKVDRAIYLLSEADIAYDLSKLKDGSFLLIFDAYDDAKNLNKFWRASTKQLKIIVEESLFWGGHKGRHEYFFTNNKNSADIVQFAFTISGIRSNINKVEYKKENWKPNYSVYKTKNQIVCFSKNCIKEERSIDDTAYCFTVPSGHFVIRRNGFISITGNCGMLSYNFGKNSKIKDSIVDLDRLIRLRIPFGQDVHDQSIINMEREFPWDRVNGLAQSFAQAYREHYRELSIPKYDIRWFQDKCDAVGGGMRRMINSIGTLGGGNHFIETGISDSGEYWITIHTGSRNFGKRICDYWQNKAVKFHVGDTKEEHKRKIERLKQEINDGRLLYEKIKEVKANKNKPVDMKGCEWLENTDAAGYLFDMIFAQIYAEVNRKYIGDIIKKILKLEPIRSIETVHNFIDFKDFIIRKGSVRSYAGEEFVLPFNMRDGILICDGKSNSEWNFSAPHGAGRVMSRTKAKKLIDIDTFKKQMEDIYSSSVDKSTLDEAPDAYKPPDSIIKAIHPTATIIERIKPIHNMKDNKEFIRKNKK